MKGWEIRGIHTLIIEESVSHLNNPFLMGLPSGAGFLARLSAEQEARQSLR